MPAPAAGVDDDPTDVVLERSSRAPLGGLPSFEYLLHVLVTFAVGTAGATFWWTTRTGTATVLAGSDRGRIIGSIVFTTALLVIEAVLFARAVISRSRPSVAAS